MLNTFGGISRCRMLSILAVIFIQPFNVHGDNTVGAPTVSKMFGEPSNVEPGAEYILAASPQDIQDQLLSNAKQKQAKSKAGQDYLLRSDNQSGLLSFPGTTFQGGHSGLWVNKLEVGGHGVFVEILADGAAASGMRVLVGWYVYKSGVQIWYVGAGNVVVEGSRQKAYIDAYRYTGGSFPPNFNVNTVSQAGSGTMWLEFNGCDNGTMGWSLPEGSGSMPIQRLSRIKDTNCNPNLGGSGGGGGGGGGGTQTIRVDFENRLLVTIEVFKNGVSLGTVPLGETRGGNYSVNIGDQFTFKAVQTYGDHMEGIYPALTETSSNKLYLVKNIVGTQHFFHPRITNNTSRGRLLGVNVGLQSQNLCNCTVPAYTANVGQSYYLLWSNSNLRLYDSTSTYNVAYWYWENFANNVEPETGRINFTLNP